MWQKTDGFSRTYLYKIMFIVAVGVFGRLIPHLPNMTPIISLSLFVGASLYRPISVAVMFFTLVISDIALSLLFGYPIFGYFTLFAYTGVAVVVLISSNLKYSRGVSPFYILGASSFYWLWTNFGVWLVGNWYEPTFDGLWNCYYMALPFLRNAMVGDFIWGYVIFGAVKFASQYCVLTEKR